MAGESRSTDSQSRIPVTLVTGFLGSGKTTLINAALRSPDLAKTVVVVNEFGEVGLDHKLFARSSDSVVVLENGCLCCTVRSDLVGTLNSLFHSRQAGEIPFFDNVVIETSGLAEPGPVLQAFLSEPTLDGLYRVASVVTLVDAVNWRGTSEQHDEAVRQVALADKIRITKLDLAEGDRDEVGARILRELRRINPSAEIGFVDWTSASVAELLTSKGFDALDPKADPRPWLSVGAHLASADSACRRLRTRSSRSRPFASSARNPFSLQSPARQSDRELRADARGAVVSRRVAVPSRRNCAKSRLGSPTGEGTR